jgi:hypothetical protein
MIAGYAFHATTASLEDRLGGVLHAGGHEITWGLGFRFL